MATARILDATRFPDGIMLHFDKAPSSRCHRIRIEDTIYRISPSLDLGPRISISSQYPADYFSRHSNAVFLDD